MAWRKWIVRGLVLTLAGTMGSACVLYRVWTDPAATRRQVLDKLREKFIGAVITLDSARLRLLGGIALSDLRMARKDDLDHSDFLHVPSAVLYHDKEALLEGRLLLRKIELKNLRLRMVRERDGQLNLQGLLGPVHLDEHVPTIVVQQGTIVVEDRGAAPGTPLLEVHDVNLTLRNDPISTLTLEGTGQADVTGPVRFRARLNRATQGALFTLELPTVPVGPALVQRASLVCPDVAAHLRQLEGKGTVTAVFGHQPGATNPWAHEITLRLHDGRFNHARLPLPLEKAEATVKVTNGQVPFVELRGHAGAALLHLTARDVQCPSHAAHLEDCVRELSLDVEHLPLTGELLTQLPSPCPEFEHDYSPRGPVSVHHAFTRTAEGQWHKSWVVKPEGLTGECVWFRYPLEQIRGVIRTELDSVQEGRVQVDLSATASGRPVTLKGELHGAKPGAVDLVLEAQGMPLDDLLFRALPTRSQQIARTFLPDRSREQGLHAQPMGRANIQAFIRRQQGQPRFANRYVISIQDASVKYDLFPLPLEEVSGVLDLLPDHWECHSFRGMHKGGVIQVEAASLRPEPGQPSSGTEGDGRAPRHDLVKVSVRGQDVPLGPEFERALAPPEAPGRGPLQNAWKALNLRGRLSFAADVVDQPDQPQDIDVSVDLRGCAIRPAFFPYEMADVNAAVRYARGWVFINDAAARHGAGRLGVKSARIQLKPGGGFIAWFDGIRGQGIVPDTDLLSALPGPMGKGLGPLRVSRPLDFATSLVLVSPREGERTKVWWDGQADLRATSLHAGIDLADVTGQVACRGHHNGQTFEGVAGNFFLERVSVLGQPLKNAHGRLLVLPTCPDKLRLTDVGADLFGGKLGGEALVEMGGGLRYEVVLKALQVRLEQFGKHNLGDRADLQGPARAEVRLWGEGTDLSGLSGNGIVQVDNGKLYRLPPLLDLLKAFGLRAPDGTAFDQARLQFAIEGPRMVVEKLDLKGGAISLRGNGTLGLDGSDLNMEFSADWARVPDMMPDPVAGWSRSFIDQVFRVKVRGRVGAVRTEPVLLPGMVSPLLRAMGRSP